MHIYFFNTLSRQKERFVPIEPNNVRLYTCGPTVYNFAHIGNLRTYIFEDVLRRVLESSGFKVNHVMNITDVGHLQSNADHGNDKIALAAKKENKDPWKTAKFYEIAFFNDFEMLFLKKPSIICRATEHIKEIQNYISIFIEKKIAYEVNGNVYFCISKFLNYNNLSRGDLINIKKKSRIDIDPCKKEQLDFVLWFSNSKFPNQIMKWESPWGCGFPGWHIECSAMASKYLGEYIDIHAGAVDHISVHHTNEIAQSESCFGHKWVNYWIHGEFLILNNEKMSKSKKNFLTLKSLINKGFNPLHYKYFCFNSHYRSQLLFTFNALSNAKNSFELLKNRIINFKLNPDKYYNNKIGEDYSKRFFNAMSDDLNSPLALSIIWKMIKDKSLGSTQKFNLMKKFDVILGFNVDSFSRPILSDEFMCLIQEREQARRNKNWHLADKIRCKLFENNIRIKDLATGTDWYLKC